MQTEFVGRNIEVSYRFRDHAEPRLRRLARLLGETSSVRVAVARHRGRSSVELTVDWWGPLLRSEVREVDDLTAFDRALEKLERQIVRYKQKLRQYPHDALRKMPASEEEVEQEEPPEVEEADETAAADIRIVRTKTHALKPMTPAEAVLQMELVGHSFYVFKDADTNQVGVVYKRTNGGYGLIEYDM